MFWFCRDVEEIAKDITTNVRFLLENKVGESHRLFAVTEDHKGWTEND